MLCFVGSLLRPISGSATIKQISFAKTPQTGVFFYGKINYGYIIGLNISKEI
jgi:hypothetical protein